MRFIFAAIVAAVAAGFGSAQARDIEVLSGDVIRVEQYIVHIANIVAPPLNAQCTNVRHVAELARAKLSEFVAQGEPLLNPTGERDEDAVPLAFVSVNGEDVGEKMIAAHLAQRRGEARDLCPMLGRRSSWIPGSKSPPNLPPMPPYGIRGGAGQRTH